LERESKVGNQLIGGLVGGLSGLGRHLLADAYGIVLGLTFSVELFDGSEQGGRGGDGGHWTGERKMTNEEMTRVLQKILKNCH
jgi:hypothetical protein